MNVSSASGHLASDLAHLSKAELEALMHDWQLWARDEQLCPSSGCRLARGSRHSGASASGTTESDVLVVNDQILQWRGPPLSGGAGCEGDNAAIALVGSSDADQARGVVVLRGNGDGQWRAELQSAMPEIAAVLAAAGFQRDAASGAMTLTGDMRWVPF